MNHRKIAELAHVSTSTVSKALSGSREVSDELAEQIRKIAFEVGYFSEKNKRKLLNKRIKKVQIAVVCPEITSIYYSRIVTLLKTFIEERGGRIAVYIFDFDYQKKYEILESISMDNYTDGIISISGDVFEKDVGVPVVCFDLSSDRRNYDTIGTNMELVMIDCISYLKSLGHSKIGFVGEKNTLAKELNFRKAMKNFNMEVVEEFIYNIDKRFEYIGIEAAKQIISSDNRPTAFITSYDEVAVSLIYYFEQAGIKVPEDISVIGLNDIPLAPYIKSSLTTVKFHHDEQAALAVDILFDKIFRQSDEVHHLLVKHELIIRESTGKAKS